MTRHVLVLVALACVLPPPTAGAQDTVVVVRHAERADSSADSPLSAVGRQRASRLATMLAKAGITQIYTTDLRRTVQTAAPAAAALGLTPATLKPEQLDELIARIRATAPRGRVLVVGHSNTVPAILRQLGVTEPVTIDDEDFGNLFVVTPQEGAAPVVLRLRY